VHGIQLQRKPAMSLEARSLLMVVRPEAQSAQRFSGRREFALRKFIQAGIATRRIFDDQTKWVLIRRSP
jgi:hypothetical protein